MRERATRPVYSTEQGRLCPVCGAPKHAGKCAEQSSAKGDGKVKIQRQTKGRNGKAVTCISGLALPDSELKLLAAQLKKKCGCGGTVKDETIEIQGDYREKIRDELLALGHKAVLAGG